MLRNLAPRMRARRPASTLTGGADTIGCNMSATPSSHTCTRSDVRLAAFELICVGTLSAVLYLWVAAREDLAGSLSDSAVYLVMADLFSPWRAAPHELGTWPFQAFPFPPAYPALLGLLGGGSDAIAASYRVTALLSAAAIVAIHAWLRAVTGNRAHALALSAALALSPAWLTHVMMLQSESPYLLLTYAALALAAQPAVSAARVRTLNGLLGGSVLVRTAGVAGIAAGVLWGWRRRVLDRYALLALLAPAAAWFGARSLFATPSRYTDVLRHDSIGTAIDVLTQTVFANLQVLPRAVSGMFGLDAGPYASAAALALALPALAGWLRRLRRLELDALFAGAYLALVLLWPYPEHLRRFLLILLPLYLGYAGGALLWVSRGTPRVRGLLATAAAVLPLAAVAPGAWNVLAPIAAAADPAAARYARAPQWHDQQRTPAALRALERSDDIIESLAGIDEHLPAGACVSSTMAHHVPLYGHRRSRWPMPATVSDRRFESALADCPWVFMVAARHGGMHGYPPMYPYQRIKDRLEVIEVKLWERGAQAGTVLTMLGRVRRSGEPSSPPVR